MSVGRRTTGALVPLIFKISAKRVFLSYEWKKQISYRNAWKCL